MNGTWRGASEVTLYELVFGGEFDWRDHLDHRRRIVYIPEYEAIPLEEIDERSQYTSSCGKSSATIL